jgi:ferrous iron transport protein A
MSPENLQSLNLAAFRCGDEGFVLRILDPHLKLALLRIGLLEGDRFAVTELAPWGGPMALRVRGGKVALRKSDALKVQVKRI